MDRVRGYPIPQGKSGSVSPGRVNSIGLQGRELEALYESLDANTPAGASRKRDFVRWPFRFASIHVTIQQPGNSVPSTVKVACRNLSCGGISLLHNSYLHVGGKVTVTLPHPETGPMAIGGYITRCNHVKGVIHEIGVKFDKPIQAREFVRSDPFSDSFSLENVDPIKLQGCVVYVDDSAMDQKIVQHYLRETQIRLRMASTAQEGLKLVGEGCDLILCDYDIPGMSGVEFVSEIRRQGIRTPLIIATSDTSQTTKDKLQGSEVNAFLAKPLAQGMLLRALAEFMMVGKSIGTANSSIPRDHPNYVLVDAFLQQLPGFLKRLNEAIAKEDATACRGVALQLKGLAPTVGFEGIAALADEAATMVSASMSVTESIRPLRALVAICERARA